jgi:GH24 family phage-related lysozyme (muramidase)
MPENNPGEPILIRRDIKILNIEIKKLARQLADSQKSLDSKSSKKTSNKTGSFLERHGYGAEDMIDAFTSKAPLIGLGIKFLLDKKKTEKAKKGLLDAQNQFAFLIKQRDKLLKMREDNSPEQLFKKRKRRKGKRIFDSDDVEEIVSPRKRKRRKEQEERESKPEKEKKKKPEKVTPETFTPDEPKQSEDNIKTGEYEDVGNQDYAGRNYTKYDAKPPRPPTNYEPRMVSAEETRKKQEEQAELLKEILGAPERKKDEPIVTPPPPIVTDPPADWVAQQNAPKLLGPGKLQRKRGPKGQFLKGYDEGNLVPKQAGVIAGFGGINNTPEPKENTIPGEPKLLGGIEEVNSTLKTNLGDLQEVIVNIGSQLTKWHKEDIDKNEELQEQKGSDNSGETPKLLEPGNSITPKALQKNKSGGGILKKVTNLFKGGKGGAGEGVAGGAEAAVGGAEATGGLGGLAEGAAGAGSSAWLGLGAAAMGGLTALKLIDRSAFSKIYGKDKKVNGVSQEEWADLESEFLYDQGVDVKKPWYMPYQNWFGKVSETFDAFAKNDKTGGASFRDWVAIHYPNIAKKTFKKEEKDQHEDKKKEQKVPTSPKVSNFSEAVKPPVAPVMSPGVNSANPISSPASATNLESNIPAPPISEISKESNPVMKKASTKMKMSPEAFKNLTNSEGYATEPYNDPPGSDHWSIGFGHQIQPGENLKSLSKPQAIELLKKDIIKYEDAVNKAIKVPLTQEQFDSLVDMSYNLGPGVLTRSKKELADSKSKPKVAEILNAGGPNSNKEAAAKIQEYVNSKNKQGKPEFNSVLAKRRNSEALAFDKDAQVAMAPKTSPNTGQNLLSTNSQIEDKKAEQNSSKNTNVVNAPSNTQVNHTNVIASTTTPRNHDNTVRDTRGRNSVNT